MGQSSQRCYSTGGCDNTSQALRRPQTTVPFFCSKRHHVTAARPPARLPPASAYCTFVFVCQAWRLHPRSAKLLICTSLCKLMSSRAQLKKQSASRFFCGKPCWRVNGRLLPVDSCQLCLLISINVCRIFSQWAPHPWFYLSVSFWFHVTSLIS